MSAARLTPLAIKIMMTPEAIDRIAASLLSRAILKDIVETSVRSPADEHYFAVTLHKGISARVPAKSFQNIAKLLSCSNTAVHRFMADHMLASLAKGGCETCRQASSRLRVKIRTERVRGRTADATRYPGCLLIY